MNKFDEKYNIRLACYDEIDDIRTFIDTNWRRGHILARDRNFFEYEMVVDGRVNFVIARERETNEIHSIHGFIYASKDRPNPDIWGVMWKTLPGSIALLGHETAKRIMDYTGARAMLSVGDNPKTTVPILKILRKYKDVSRMQHFYCLANRRDYTIAVINHRELLPASRNENVPVKFLADFDELKKCYNPVYYADNFPHKDLWYINHRYFEHPIFRYLVYGLGHENDIKAFLVCREQEYNGNVALRIVDYMGQANLFAGLNDFLRENLEKYEYIDLYCHGFDTAYVKIAGMTEIIENDTNIIPNYFSPYDAKNIDIWCGAPIKGGTFFKADGDQDRPC